MKKIFPLFFFLFLFISGQTQTPKQESDINSNPKLVIGIVIDQMRYDYIDRYWNKFGNDGFKRLVNEGFFLKNTNYNYAPTYTAPGHASIYTGATPSVHGIIANEWFNKLTGNNTYCATDAHVDGVGTSTIESKCSPANMFSTTITDELRVSSNMRSKVIGIALKDRSAIFPAGHKANAAYWYDGSNGCFVTSTYYMNELPVWVQEFNKKEMPLTYLNQAWNTLLPIEQYTESLPDDNKYEMNFVGETKPVFPHNIPKLKGANGGLNMIRSIPFGNSLTKDFAIETIKNENLGKSEATDFLAISFSSPDYIGHSYGPRSVEQEDDYLRLDKDLAEFLKFIDAEIGKNNVLIFLTADHAASEVPAYLMDLNIPAGYVEGSRMIDSLKKNVLRKYGNSLVLSFSNQQIFLDHKIIEDKKLDLQQVQEYVATFLQSMPAVSEVLIAATINDTSFTKGPRSLMQKGFNTKRSGDVLVNYQSGWMDYHHQGTTHGSPYSYDTHVPLIFYGWKIKQGNSEEQVAITDIAATLAMMLKIPSPNGCSGKPLLFLSK